MTLILYVIMSSYDALFDNLSDLSSDSEFYSDSNDSDSEVDLNSFITEDSDEYDPIGPDLIPPDDTESELSVSEPSSSIASATASLLSLSLQPSPVYLPIRPGDTITLRSRSVSLFSQLSPEPKPEKKIHHTISARIMTLSMFTLGYKEAEYKEATGISQSGVYKIRSKAKAYRQSPGKVIQVEHMLYCVHQYEGFINWTSDSSNLMV